MPSLKYLSSNNNNRWKYVTTNKSKMHRKNSLNMKVSSNLVISVILCLHNKFIFRCIFNLNMKVSSILVVSVIIKLQTYSFLPCLKFDFLLILKS